MSLLRKEVDVGLSVPPVQTRIMDLDARIENYACIYKEVGDCSMPLLYNNILIPSIRRGL